MALTENLNIFFDVGGFAVAATWSVGAATVNGIFDKDYALQLGLVDGSNPIFMCKAADMPTAAQGQTLTIAGIVYTITDVKPDGSGVLIIELRA